MISGFGARLGSKVVRPETLWANSAIGSLPAAAGEASFRSLCGGTKNFGS
jgi:hypothetical protein